MNSNDDGPESLQDDDTDYTPAKAEFLVGKRVIVSLRHILPDQQEEHSGLWGVVDSVHENGILLRVEGGIDDDLWMMPPDLGGIRPAESSVYQLGEDGEIVENVDFEAHWRVSSDPELL